MVSIIALRAFQRVFEPAELRRVNFCKEMLRRKDRGEDDWLVLSKCLRSHFDYAPPGSTPMSQSPLWSPPGRRIRRPSSAMRNARAALRYGR